MSTADLLAQGIAAARAGRKDEAQATLLKVLETDDRSELAWLWLSGVMGSPDERRICLENVLEINPANTHARRGIELLAQSHPPAPRADCPRPAPGPPEPAPQPTPAPQPATTLRLPDANGNPPPAAATSVTAPAGPVTGDTVELPPEALQTPAKQPWWRR
ncbi:MAG: hypothetical protein HGA45_00610 [Chloroflexales bacterium]|nr:hypothetical protein [Chloroflexales bacterium]